MRFDAVIENEDGASRIVLVCEHASNHFPPDFGTLGLSPEVQAAHVAWDPGALGLARGLAARLDAVLVHARVSRLVYDLNRPPHSPGAMAERSEIHDIPGNHGLDAAQRMARVEQVYLPFHNDLHWLIAGRMVQGRPPVLVTVHSFTPVYHGEPRSLEIGLIHDGDDRLARGILHHLGPGRNALNEPYSAADGVTHLLRLHAGPYALPHAMIEVRNDLLASDEARSTMAARLSEAIAAALEDI